MRIHQKRRNVECKRLLHACSLNVKSGKHRIVWPPKAFECGCRALCSSFDSFRFPFVHFNENGRSIYLLHVALGCQFVCSPCGTQIVFSGTNMRQLSTGSFSLSPSLPRLSYERTHTTDNISPTLHSRFINLPITNQWHGQHNTFHKGEHSVRQSQTQEQDSHHSCEELRKFCLNNVMQYVHLSLGTLTSIIWDYIEMSHGSIYIGLELMILFLLLVAFSPLSPFVAVPRAFVSSQKKVPCCTYITSRWRGDKHNQ